MITSLLLGGMLLCATARPASALDVKVSANALERTLRTQLFNSPDGRYYLRGTADSPCYVYAEDPKVSFQDDRVVVHVHTQSRLGTPLHGTCLGVSLNTDADVSVVPDAEGESIGFRDARIEKLSKSKELNFLLVPFLSRKLPSQMKINAADLVRKLLTQSAASTGYTLTLDSLKFHSLQVQGTSILGSSLVLDLDAAMEVN
ncbi:MAG: hypothetical protein KGK08_13790 [Acidobacteriota bacterium]|nr:hypothetical protein [Acidobacteriota bacterium]